MKIENIFITHLHGDHTLGMPGLMQTMGLSGRDRPLNVYGPSGIREALGHMLAACEGDLEYELNIHEVSDGDEIDIGYAKVSVFATEHLVTSVGYVYREPDQPGTIDSEKARSLGLIPSEDYESLREGRTVKGVSPEQVMSPTKKGCSLVYTGDTEYCENVVKASKDADILIHEATYVDADRELAKANHHSTAKIAAEIAQKCNVRMLALIHISNRYDDLSVPLNEAKAIFGNTVVPEDMQMYTVLRGEIRSV